MTGAMAILFASTGLLEISKTEDIKWIFIGIGTYSIVIGVMLYFGIKEVDKKSKNAN